MNYETVIGLEVHAELKTETKIFCSCSAKAKDAPNTNVCPVCLGLPGTLPTLNENALRLSVLAGICLNCKIAPLSKFDRKNYFYPDLPKAYQISQYDIPLCTDGYLDIETGNGKKRIGITRIHMEEDAGKLFHRNDATLIDCNRCGIPLIEIVSEPHISSGTEAVAYLKKLREILVFAGISDGKMNEGSLRCDVNLSVRKKGEPMGVRCELKNLNSFKFVEKAIEYERDRQIAVLESGGVIEQETRRFDEKDLKTYFMRKKESQADYRFFEEPDLPHIVITEEYLENLKSSMPTPAHLRRERYLSEWGIPISDGEVLTLSVEAADYFERCAAETEYKRIAANIIITELPGLSQGGGDIRRIAPQRIGALCDVWGKGIINSATAKKLIRRMWDGEELDPVLTVEKEGLSLITDFDKVRSFVLSAIAKSEKAVEDYKKGKATAARSIVGKAMGESRGRAEPELVARLVTEELDKM
ncbi:MAG: Asp-tRNA(Asn)/Glu-tRNA(Gln) amidotransferase subunit GatB [Clostridia bacterium]|nr:Asp-tRNA(Asn)/Glu-tRNA(Gln) amidotransferase subunit GatB [Clostridia bacterium]